MSRLGSFDKKAFCLIVEVENLNPFFSICIKVSLRILLISNKCRDDFDSNAYSSTPVLHNSYHFE